MKVALGILDGDPCSSFQGVPWSASISTYLIEPKRIIDVMILPERKAARLKPDRRVKTS